MKSFVEENWKNKRREIMLRAAEKNVDVIFRRNSGIIQSKNY